ncbi:hypothetical protein NDU88_006172 [Pleurodeles waltl]|uniref:G-protein coupled receptors family 1 profile domain-containing protein n=1 Tax=Pleurodeles waltl TaxID=8319 RepID=A0AAV7QHY8_PLEWA|nr:hypothetical protein NDU88_006172 [Pleurodeles waltl]
MWIERKSNVDLHSLYLLRECSRGEGSEGGGWSDDGPEVHCDIGSCNEPMFLLILKRKYFNLMMYVSTVATDMCQSRLCWCRTFRIHVAIWCCLFRIQLNGIVRVVVSRNFHKSIFQLNMGLPLFAVLVMASVRQRCLEEQKRRRQRATKKISTYIGTFLLCFAPYVITRLVELSSFTPISPHWGIISKCMAYSKAVSDPFVYSLLRNQYKKTWKDMVNKILKRSSINSSALTGELHRRNVVQTTE